MKILITEPIHQSGVDLLQREGVEVHKRFNIPREDLLKIINNYDAMIIRSDTQVDTELLNEASKLKVVGMAGIGLNHVDLIASEKKGVVVHNVPDGSVDSVAELAIGLFIASSRKLTQANLDTKDGRWNKTGYLGNTLDGKILGIISLGKIGSRVANLAKGFGMVVYAYDPFLSAEEVNIRGAEKKELKELLELVDMLSIHAPLTSETYHLIGANEIEIMKDGSFLFNLGRGGVVDEDALYEALVSGKLKGAGLDVMEIEPANKSQLFGLDNVIVTPHIGAGTEETQQYISESIAMKVYESLSTQRS